jgi:hypothetical protein
LEEEAKVVEEVVGTTLARSRAKTPWYSSWFVGGGGIISANSIPLALRPPLPPLPAKLEEEAKVVEELVAATPARLRAKTQRSSSWFAGCGGGISAANCVPLPLRPHLLPTPRPSPLSRLSLSLRSFASSLIVLIKGWTAGFN